MRDIPLLIDFLIQIPELDPEYPSRSYPCLPFPYMHKNISIDRLKVYLQTYGNVTNVLQQLNVPSHNKSAYFSAKNWFVSNEKYLDPAPLAFIVLKS